MMGHLQRGNLTDAELGIVKMLKDGPLTVKQLSRRRKTTRQAVEKLLKSMEKKGEITRQGCLVVAYRCTPQGVGINMQPPLNADHPIRLHGEEWSIGIIYGSQKWERKRAGASSFWLEGNRIVPYRDSLTIFSYQSFEGIDCDEAERQASPYWVRFFRRIEQLYGIIVLKERSENIRRVKAHYADTGNELADELRKKKEKLRVFSTKDGKEWLLADDSHSLSEFETTHSATRKDDRTAKEDMEQVVAPVFNDLRDLAREGRLVLPSQQLAVQAQQNATLDRILSLLAEQATAGRDTAVSVQSLARLMELQLQAQNMGPPQLDPLPPGKKPDYFG